MSPLLLLPCVASALVTTTHSETAKTCGNAEWGQCGGSGWKGDSCCPDYDKCTFVNAYYSQCQAKDLCLNAEYSQCGGMDHHQPPRSWTKPNHHQTCCPKSFSCVYQSQYYSQCEFNSTTSTCATAYGQCGGKGWTGPTCCIPGFKCTADAKNPIYYSGCKPIPICSNARFGQCGGVDADQKPWTKENGHSGCCPEGFECSYVNQYYSQCKKKQDALEA